MQTPQKSIKPTPPEPIYEEPKPLKPLKPVINKTPFVPRGKEGLISNKRSQDHIYTSPDLNVHKPVRMTIKEVERAKHNAKKYGVNEHLREYDLRNNNINARPSVFDKNRREQSIQQSRNTALNKGGYNSVKPQPIRPYSPRN